MNAGIEDFHPCAIIFLPLFPRMDYIKDFLFKNQTLRQTVLKNTFWQLIAQVLGRGIRAIIIIYAARVLGATEYGIFSYAIGFAGLFAVFADIAVDPIVIREVSKSHAEKEKIIGAALYLKLFLNLLTYLAIVTIGTRLTPVAESRVLIPLIGLAFIADALRQFGFSITNAMERMEVDAGVSILYQSATVFFGIAALTYWKTPYALAVSYALGSAVGAFAIIFYLRDILRVAAMNFDGAILKRILKDALPFTFLGVTGIILTNTDTVMLGWFSSPEQIGYYSVALKLVQILFVLPPIVAMAIFPSLSRNIEKEEGPQIIEKALAVINLIALPIVIGGVLEVNTIIPILYGQGYVPAAQPLRILLLTIALNYPSTIMGYAILAHNQQIKTMKYFALAALVNISLNYLLIPRLGIVGAATTTLIAQFVAALGYYLVLKRIVAFKLLQNLWKPLAAASLMGGVIFILRFIHLPAIPILIAAAITYPVVLYLVKDPIFEDLKKALALA